jgi:cytochrome c-type biogenesis protein CcmF
VLTYALAAFVTATVVQEFARGVRARRALHGETETTAFVALFRRNGRRYGGYVVHLGIVMVVVAIATSQARTTELERTLAPGDAMDVAGYHVALVGLRDIAEPQRASTVADLVITGNGTSERLHPGLVQYPNSQQAIGSPGITAGARDDIYTILAAYDGTGKAWATIRVRIIPLVSWLWAGGAVVGLGALLAAWPPPKRRPVVVPVAVAEAVGAE